MKRYLNFVSGKPSPMRGNMASRNARGFSMVELLIVLIVTLIMTAVAGTLMGPIARLTRLENAYNTTLMTMRQAREKAVSTRWIYIVSFTSGSGTNSIAITRQFDGSSVATYNLPDDIKFDVESGVPTTNTGTDCTPDCFGNAALAIDFDQGVSGGDKTKIFFYPDGSARDINGAVNNGVVYVAIPGNLSSSRAITLWGATGRLRGWRLFAAAPHWRQQ